MAREALRGTEMDGRADVFALGVCAFRLLTGEVPVLPERGETDFDYVHRLSRLEGQGAAWLSRLPALPEPAAVVLARMLASDREQRPYAARGGRGVRARVRDRADRVAGARGSDPAADPGGSAGAGADRTRTRQRRWRARRRRRRRSRRRRRWRARRRRRGRGAVAGGAAGARASARDPAVARGAGAPPGRLVRGRAARRADPRRGRHRDPRPRRHRPDPVVAGRRRAPDRGAARRPRRRRRASSTWRGRIS